MSGRGGCRVGGGGGSGGRRASSSQPGRRSHSRPPSPRRPTDRQLCLQAFKMYDKRGKGHIPKSELTSLLRSMGQNPTDSEVHDMINQVDVDGSGVVEFDEFCQFVDKLMKNIDPENEAREAYRRFDPDGEGRVSADEMRFVLSNLPVPVSDDEVDAIVSAGDLNGDGSISFQEFRRMLGI